ncbi:hypothetical protein Adt_18063 [Abeliophyllum distichum]|uniref:Uncharacterized protein n=1 Tax=Abeliophyllum distichum TaxID=126358 RepID=A0ABD1TIU1_9LAMI
MYFTALLGILGKYYYNPEMFWPSFYTRLYFRVTEAYWYKTSGLWRHSDRKLGGLSWHLSRNMVACGGATTGDVVLKGSHSSITILNNCMQDARHQNVDIIMWFDFNV